MSDTDKPQSICEECGTDDTYTFNPFGYGRLLDYHMDIEVSSDELNKRLASAGEMAKRFGGSSSFGLSGELDELTRPKLTWQDFIRYIKASKISISRKNNWKIAKRKPLTAGLFVPRKIDYKIKFLLIYDCSGSMSKEQISYGISQVAALSERAEGFCLPFDSQPFYDAMTTIKNATVSELRNAKYKGGGGTVLMPALTSYQKEIGNVDIIIIVSDFYLFDIVDVMKFSPPPNTQIVWLSMAVNPQFEPKHGRKFNLMND